MTSANPGRWFYGMLSHPGSVRKINEDRVFMRHTQPDSQSECLLALVADGMGGHPQGDVASETALQMTKKWWESNIPHQISPEAEGIVLDRIRRLFENINSSLYAYGQSNNLNLGTTLSVIFLLNDKYYICHVGDSRIYRVIKPTATMGYYSLQQLTEDQSWVAMQVRLGNMTPEEARVHPRRNLILQCLGVVDSLEVFTTSGTIADDDRFFLCSDGFHSLFSGPEIDELFARSMTPGIDYQTVCRRLMQAALERGASDNVSVSLIGR